MSGEPEGASAARGRRPPAPARFVQAWTRVRRFERTGRIYEALGLRSVFSRIAGMFGEELPPSVSARSGSHGAPEAERLLRSYARTRYHELVNLIALAVYAALLAMLVIDGQGVLAVYCLLLMVTHALPALMERYKRARYEAILDSEGIADRTISVAAVWRPQAAKAPACLTGRLASAYFTPRRFETDRFYRMIGMEAFRAFVLRLFEATMPQGESAIARATGAPGAEADMDRFLKGRSDVIAFETNTRIAEATHLTGMLLHIPFAAAFIAERSLAGALYVALMLATNLACVLLQRWHRARLWPIVCSIRHRSASGASHRPGASSPPRILIVTAAAGDGHLSAARALARALEARGVQADVVDALDFAPRAFRWWFQGGYETLVRRAPRLWGALYHGSDGPGLFYAVQSALDFACLGRLERLIRQNPPDWVVCTHSLAQPRLMRIRKRGPSGPRPRIAVVVTDLHPHRMWLRGIPDRYFVPDKLTLERLDARRPGASAITTVTGIPVDPSFAEPMSRAEARAALGMDRERPCIVLMSGGIGGGPIVEAMRALVASPSAAVTPVVTVVCGRNARAHRACLRAAHVCPSGAGLLNVEGYVPHDRFVKLLRGADLLVGKPGGLTMAECLASGVPMVIFRPMLIPGQEEDNAVYLSALGASEEAADPDELRRTVERRLGSMDDLRAWQERVRQAGRPHAAFDIADALIGM